MLAFLFVVMVVGMTATTAMPFGAVHAGFDIAFRQIDIFQADPGVDRNNVETDLAFIADFHQRAANQQRILHQQVQGVFKADIFRDDFTGFDGRG